MLRRTLCFVPLLGLSLLTVGCASGPAGEDDTDSPSTDASTDTDLLDTGGSETGDADTDVGDTDATDTDVVDTDVPCEDADVDGLCDNVDLCFGDNSFGDLDADAICDNTDLCSGDNATLDEDMDGICGNLDLCIGGDIWGDTDADGTCDDQDVCFGVDASNDSDGDGICDDNDLCNGDDYSGDSDGDFICDRQDLCPLGDDNVDLDTSGYPDACEPVELGRVHIVNGGYGVVGTVYPYASFVIQVSASCPASLGGSMALGQRVALSTGATGTYSFDAGDGDGFTAVASCLTDGVEQTHLFWAAFSDGPNQAYASVGGSYQESTLGGSPDFAGHTIVRVDLEVTSVSVAPDGSGGTHGTSEVDWVFYGYALP